MTAKKEDKVQMTCIPTGAVSIGGVFYMFVMSIVTWKPRWTIEDCALYISRDKGISWEKSPEVHFSKEEAPSFGQVFPLEVGEYVYLFGIPEARDGACKLARVPKEKLDNFEKYEYYIGNKGDAPVFVAGREGLRRMEKSAESVVIDAPCGEMSVMYNEYLKKYLAVYLGTSSPGMVFRDGRSAVGAVERAGNGGAAKGLSRPLRRVCARKADRRRREIRLFHDERVAAL